MVFLFLLLVGMGANPPKIGVAVDAGHGGSNLGGATKTFYVDGKKKRMVEKTYTCDIAERLVARLKQAGVETGTTTTGKCLNKAQDFTFSPWPLSSTERFSTNRQIVRRSKAGLRQRVLFAEEFLRPYEKKFFISIHVDVASRNDSGAFIQVPQGCPIPVVAERLAALLAQAGLAKRFITRSTPIVINGERNYQNVLILREPPVCESILVEVANINNPLDRKRLRDPGMREKYARLIAEAILDS